MTREHFWLAQPFKEGRRWREQGCSRIDGGQGRPRHYFIFQITQAGIGWKPVPRSQ